MNTSEKKYFKASFTIETTYISIFIFFSILLIIYLTLMIYNVSVLTSNAYIVLLEKSESYEDSNESLENELYEEACEVAKRKSVVMDNLQVETKTEFKQLEIVYHLVMDVPIADRLSKIFGGKIWEIKVNAVTNRVRLKESLQLMKVIRGGIKE